MKKTILVAWIALNFSLLAAQGRKLSLEEIFSDRFRMECLVGIQWMPDGQSFAYPRRNPETKRTDIWAYRVSDGRREVLVRSEDLRQGEGSEPFEFDHFAVSPDGGTFLFTGTLVARSTKTGGDFCTYEPAARKFRIVARSDEEQKIIRFSPDGKKIGFVRGSDIHVVDLADLAETRLTHDGSENVLNGHFDWVYEEEFSVIDGWQWSPDSAHIAYWRLDQSEVPRFPLLNYEEPHPEIAWTRYPNPGDSNSTVRIGVASLASGETRWMDIGEGKDIYIPRIQWLPDGKRLAIQRLNRAQNKLELLLADIETGESSVILAESDPSWVDVADDLAFLSDGRRFVWSSERTGYLHLYLCDTAGSPIRQLTKGEWEVCHSLGVDEISGQVYFVAAHPNHLERHLFAVDIESLEIRRISSEPGTHDIDFSPGFSHYIDTHSTIATPPCQRLHRSSGELVRVIEANEMPALREYALAQAEFFSFETSDKVTLHGQMFRPVDFDPNRRHPVLMYVYGGPGSQTVQNAWPRTTKLLWHNLLTQRGYVVVTIDNRGTGGRGKAFESATYKNLGFWESHDQIEAAKHLAKQPWVDPGRIGIWGWSYGGYMAALSMCRGGDVFKAGVAVAPVTHWKYYDSIYTERFMGTPEQNPEGYKESSPFAHIDGLKGMIFLIHGTGDDNVHFQNTIAFANALVEKGKAFETAFYPYRLHGIGGRDTQLHLFRAITRFLLQNL